MKKTARPSSSAKPRPLQDSKQAQAYFKAVMSFTLGPAELKRRMQLGDALNVIDVRRNSAFEAGHIPGAVNLPRETWESAQGLSRERINVLYCTSQQCHLAPEACLYYAGEGYPVMHLDGGMEAWRDYGFDVESSPASIHEPESMDIAQAA